MSITMQMIWDHWQAKLIFGAWLYAVCSFIYVLLVRRPLMNRSSRELFNEFPDVLIAIAIVMALLPPFAATLLTRLLWEQIR